MTMSEKRGPETMSDKHVPPFVSVTTSAALAYGRTSDDFDFIEVVLGLDREGRVWRYYEANPEFKNAQSGWKILEPLQYEEGIEPAPTKAILR
jgi:hypothetical protein